MNWREDLAGSEQTPVLIGCTASGKTGLLMKLREKHDFQVISADSRQIYRGMDIGTAKPTPDERSLLKHHLLDCLDPDRSFSAGEFSRAAVKLIGSIRSEGSVPVVAGGTALYVMALTGGLDPMPERCPGLRRGFTELEAEAPGILSRLLHKADPAMAEKVGSADVRRQIRSLEIFALTGCPPSKLRKGGDKGTRNRYRIAGISLPREELRRRIDRRAGEMMSMGLIDEVRGLLEAGWDRSSVLGRTIGYSDVLDYLEGKIDTKEELRESIAVNTWRLARRQKNMFRRIPEVTWVDPDPAAVEACLFGEGKQ